MAGLGLNVGGYGSATTGTASLPTAASQPGSATVAQRAFGISSLGDGGPDLAAKGAVAAGVIGAALLVFLWHSLPR
jgi:hypothetical protein